ncbi:MAG TPA: NupC/NupG family nucleoside CNT transporter [Micropruina sp.]|jgi:CNT family concentrative nucleoside transporter|nr:NupC/NupG family nucleoside CNT transporter [Micropruina sp.]
MDRFQGVLGIVAILGLVVALSRFRTRINWRILGAGFALQVVTALLVLKWEPGFKALEALSAGVSTLIGYADEGTKFVFGALLDQDKIGFVFALSVLPVIIFIGALIGLLYYLRVIQWFIEIVGTAMKWVVGVSKIESVWATTVIFLGMSEAPLVIAPYLKKLTKSALFTCMVGGFASVAGSTLVGYSLLGAPLPYLIAASVMNAPASLVIAKGLWPETEESDLDGSVRDVKDTESANVIDALARGALSGGHLAVIVGCLLIAFIATIALANGLVSGVAGWFGHPEITFDKIFGWIFAPVAWLIGVPWNEAPTVGNLIGQKTVLNEFVAYSTLGPMVTANTLSSKSVVISTFALAGFANFGSIAIMIGSLGSLVPERRGEIARNGLFALLGGTLANLLNASIAGVVAG